MAISKPTMFGRKTPMVMYGYGIELGWHPIKLNMAGSSKVP
jgi:hypothetical protein